MNSVFFIVFFFSKLIYLSGCAHAAISGVTHTLGGGGGVVDLCHNNLLLQHRRTGEKSVKALHSTEYK